MNFIKFGTLALFLIILTCSPKPVLKEQFSYRLPVLIYCGDFTGDIDINITDIMALKFYLFNQGKPPAYSIFIADVNCDKKVSITDIVYLIKFCFKKGSPPCNPDGDNSCDCYS